VELAGVAGFVAADEREGAGLVGEFGEGQRGSHVGRDRAICLVDFRALGLELIIDGGGFEGPHALLAPASGNHFFHEIEFDIVGRLEAADVGFPALEVVRPVFSGKHDGGRGESVFDRVL
jgi:hypothetical protein